MEIKEYIDHFSEISHLKREEQFVLLEQARDEIQLNSAWPRFKAIALIVRVSFLIVLTGASYLIWGVSTWGIIIPVLVGLLISRIVITEINDHLILKGLKRVLSKKTL